MPAFNSHENIRGVDEDFFKLFQNVHTIYWIYILVIAFDLHINA